MWETTVHLLCRGAEIVSAVASRPIAVRVASRMGLTVMVQNTYRNEFGVIDAIVITPLADVEAAEREALEWYQEWQRSFDVVAF